MTCENISLENLRTGSNVTIRSARIDDMPAVAFLIQELGIHQKLSLPPGSKVNFERLQRDGFLSSPPAFHCIVAEASQISENQQLVSGPETDNNGPPAAQRHLVGYAIYFPTYSPLAGRCLFLQEFFVQDSYRQQGIGSQLFQAVIEAAKVGGYKRVDLHVLQWNPARAFYERRGAINLTQDQGLLYYRLKPKPITST